MLENASQISKTAKKDYDLGPYSDFKQHAATPIEGSSSKTHTKKFDLIKEDAQRNRSNSCRDDRAQASEQSQPTRKPNF